MTPADLIDLARRKNAAHMELLRARGMVRVPAGSNKMTEKDRDIDMDFRTLDQREKHANLADEFAIRVSEYQLEASARQGATFLPQLTPQVP